MNKKNDNNTQRTYSYYESWDFWHKIALKELDGFGNAAKQRREWQNHLQKGMYCFYDCLIEDCYFLWNVSEDFDGYEGIEFFIDDFIKLITMVDAFHKSVVCSLRLESKQDYRDLKDLVLSHSQWYKIQRFASSVYDRLQAAHAARKEMQDIL